MEGGNETGVCNVIPVVSHMSDAQFSHTAIPSTPAQPPKPVVDVSNTLSKKKKKQGRDEVSTPAPVGTAQFTPQQRPASQPVGALQSGGGNGTYGSAVKPLSSSQPLGMTRTLSGSNFPVQPSGVKSPVVSKPVASLAAAGAAMPTGAASPVQKSQFPVSKELASLLGASIPRNPTPVATTPTLGPKVAGSSTAAPAGLAPILTAEEKKRKRDEDMVRGAYRRRSLCVRGDVLCSYACLLVAIWSQAPMAKWSNQERDDFVKLFKVHGREWTDIAKHLPSKTAAQVKNFYQNNKRTLQLEGLESHPGSAPATPK